MITTRLSLTLALSLVASGQLAAQTTWYVDAQGTPPGSGTLADPYVTIQAALEAPATQDGHRVSVAPGTYTETVDYGDKLVRIVSQKGPHVTTIVAPGPNGITVDFTRANRPIATPSLRGFTLQGRGADSTGVRVTASGRGIVQFCVIRGHRFGAYNSSKLYVDSCTVVENDTGFFHEGGGSGCAQTLIFSSIFWENEMDTDGEGLSGLDWLVDSSLRGVDPEFVPAAGDYHLTAGSPAIDSGISSTFIRDPDGSRTDVGALPFDPSWPVATNYCAPRKNSTGDRGRLSASGSSSVSAGDLEFLGDRLPASQVGLLFQGSERVYTPLANGFLCAGAPISRLAIASTSAAGTIQFAFDAADPPGMATPAVAGETRSFQFWHRDTDTPPESSNLTNGVEVLFGL